jgi:circadian clock protein KaiC
VLVRGAPGAGKTTLGLQFLLEGVRQNEHGLLVSFEEFPRSLHRDARSLGWDLDQVQDTGRFHMLFTSPGVFFNDLSSVDGPINQLLRQKDVRRIVLDSITHFTRLTQDPIKLRSLYHTVINGLKREGATSLLLGEASRVSNAPIEKGHLSFIVDGIILLHYVEVESAIQRAITILKMRSTHHAQEIRHYEIGQAGLVVTGVFEGRERILSGVGHCASV